MSTGWCLPLCDENVFRREKQHGRARCCRSGLTPGRVLHLLNRTDTAKTHRGQMPENLQRAIGALAARMDRERDVLVIYMTSHGARTMSWRRCVGRWMCRR